VLNAGLPAEARNRCLTRRVPLDMALTMFTTTWCGYCRRLKSQLDRTGIEYTEVDIEQDPDGAELVEHANSGNQTVPTLLFDDGSTLTNPSVRDVERHLASLAG
jgi:mycoredoxin